MTATDSPHTFQTADDQSILPNSTNEVLAARWMKSTRSSQKRAEQLLVTFDQQYSKVTRQLHQMSQQLHGFGSGSEHCFSRRASLRVMRFRERLYSARPESDLWRGTSTRSSPAGISNCWIRKDSRNSRFLRFRATAFPCFFETLTPIRECGKSLTTANTSR